MDANLAGGELEGAERVGDALQRVDNAVGEVVGRIDAPRGAGARVGRVRLHPVEDRVPHGRVVAVQQPSVHARTTHTHTHHARTHARTRAPPHR